MKIIATVNYEYIEEARKAGRQGVVLQGSAGSGKTFAGLQWCALTAASTEGIRIAIYRQFRQSCKEALVPDFKRIMGDEFLNKWDDKRWNGSDLIYRFPNGATIEFLGCENAGKLKGKRSDVAYVNEVNEVNREAFNQVNMRTGFTICDLNPSHAHWIYDFRADPEFDYKETTFRDNPMLPEGQRNTILGYEPTKENIGRRTADDAMWQIYGLGKPATLKGLIFNNWVESDEWPDVNACERVGYGCDIGFVDPTTVVECRLSRNTLYVRQRVWSFGLTDLPNPESYESSLVEECQDNEVKQDLPIYVDNAYPQSIKALRSYKFNALPCEKGAGSIMEGIMMLRRYRIKIHSSSRQLVKEFSSYCWKMDGGGLPMDKPLENGNDHGIDAIRYFAKAQLANAMMGNPRQKRIGRAVRGAVKHY